jgi:hypothetical protein
MILQDWSEAWRIYWESRKRLEEGYWSWRNARTYWRTWAASIGICLSTGPLAIGIWTEDIIIAAVGIVLLPLVVWARQLEAADALAKKFPDEYSTHGLAQYPYSTRLKYYHYALFLNELVYQEYSCEYVKELSSFADIAKPPDLPKFQLSQHPSIIFLLGAFSTLFITSITKLPNWEKIAVPILIVGVELIALGVGVIPSWYQAINRPKHEHLTLQRFLIFPFDALSQ